MNSNTPDLPQQDPEMAFITPVTPSKPAPSPGKALRRITLAVCIPVAAIVGIESFKLGVHTGTQLQIERQQKKPYRLSGSFPDKRIPW